jgi:hypothetical protein
MNNQTPDILCIPKKGFLRDRKPYSLILSQVDIVDFDQLWDQLIVTFRGWCFGKKLKDEWLHFSLVSCFDKDTFKENDVLSVNVATGKYAWRKPYVDPYP